MFPEMSLWRASQMVPLQTGSQTAEHSAQFDLSAVKNAVAATRNELEAESSRLDRHIRRATVISIAVAAFVIGCNAYFFAAGHHAGVEIFSIWLPSVLGALHGYGARKQHAPRKALIDEFLLQLRFVQGRLFPGPTLPEQAAVDQTENLRLLCKVVASYSQREISFALAEEPPLPV